MIGLLILLRVFTSVVLAYAAITKLVSHGSLATTATNLGVSPWLARHVGWLLPLTELTVAAILLPGATAWFGAVGALALLGMFTALIAWNLARGNRPACACFGDVSAAPISEWTLARNIVLTALAAFVVVRGPDGAGPGLLAFATMLVNEVGLTKAVAAIGLVVAAQTGAAAVFVARRYYVQKHPAPVGLAPGTQAPSFNLPALDGQRVALANLLARGRAVVLIFIQPTCSSCIELLPDISHWHETYDASLTFALLSAGSAEAVREKLGVYPMPIVLLHDGEVPAAYLSRVTPGAVVVGPDGRITSYVSNGSAGVRELVEATVRRGVPAQALR